MMYTKRADPFCRILELRRSQLSPCIERETFEYLIPFSYSILLRRNRKYDPLLVASNFVTYHFPVRICSHKPSWPTYGESLYSANVYVNRIAHYYKYFNIKEGTSPHRIVPSPFLTIFLSESVFVTLSLPVSTLVFVLHIYIGTKQSPTKNVSRTPSFRKRERIMK